jgi:hypothetical protein
MTVQATSAVTSPAIPNGVTTVFAFGFHAASADELDVLIDGIVADPGLYTVALNAGNEGGSVTFTIAPTGDELIIKSNPLFTQQTEIANSGPFLAQVVEQALDRAAVRDIHLNRKIDESFANTLLIDGMATAATRAVIKASPDRVANVSAFVLTESGYEGTFIWRAGDFSGNVISDPYEQFYLVADGVPATTGAWVRVLRDLQQPPLPVPPGFDWYPPIQIYRTAGGVYSTDFDPDLWKVTDTTADIYVNVATGNNANPGTLASPVKDVWQAFTLATALPDENINIYVEAGEYANSGGALPDKNINMIARNGRVLMTGHVPRGAWTLDGAGTYKASLSGYNVFGVRDRAFPVTWPNGETTPQRLALAASKAACQATPSTYFSDGVDVWVHLQDGRLPVDTAGADVGVIHIGSASLVVANTPDRQYFFQKIDCEGAGFSSQASSGTRIGRIVFDDCRVWHSIDRTFSISACKLAILNNCREYDVDVDAMAYGPIGAGELPTYAVEIACEAYKVGPTGDTNNGSTNHGTGRTVRINCIYRDTLGPLCADVNDVRSWCLGCDAQDSLMTSNDKQDTCFQCGSGDAEAVSMWLDGCISGGSHFDFYCAAGSNLHYRNMALPASVGGTGSVAPY